MARIRTRAHRKAERLSEETKHFLDWKHYVRLFPWATVGLAAAVGFWLVPKKSRSIEQKLLDELANRKPVVVPVPASVVKKSGFLSELGGYVRSALLKAGMAYATQYLAQSIAAGTASARAPQSPTPIPPNLRTPYGTARAGR